MSRILIEIYPEDGTVLFSTEHKNAVDFDELTELQQKIVRETIGNVLEGT